jgi:hypothetical protein
MATVSVAHVAASKLVDLARLKSLISSSSTPHTLEHSLVVVAAVPRRSSVEASKSFCMLHRIASYIVDVQTKRWIQAAQNLCNCALRTDERVMPLAVNLADKTKLSDVVSEAHRTWVRSRLPL